MRSGIAASAIAHLSVLMLVLLFTEVHPFGSVTAEPIMVDLVSPSEAAQALNKEKPDREPQPFDGSDLPKSPPPSSPPGTPVPAAAQPSPQEPAALSTLSPDPQQAAVAPQQPSVSPSPAFAPPVPDLSIKYHVMLGLPPALPITPPTGQSGDDFDAQSSEKADVESSLINEFRRHLRTCSKLPKSIAPSDKIRITLRVLMTPDGKLAREPVLIEASASAKGPALMQGAISALEACQPYAMLPVDRYGEWKVIDLSFAPRDFGG